ncbi:MAG TPA: hypothetical protein PKJ26_03425 [Candidatus Woesebacteria bacterium]|nr:hypothetical protein [Candidatus Woesebacteria bacterium]HNS65521.1 hypothetical protein [Candidatus Woesebacteria bacterium]
MSGTLRSAELHMGEYAQKFGVEVRKTKLPARLFDGRLRETQQIEMREVQPALLDYFDTQAQLASLQQLIELFGTPNYQIDGVAAVAFLLNFHVERINREKQRDEATALLLMKEIWDQWQQEIIAAELALQTERASLAVLQTSETETELVKADFESPLVAGVDYAIKEKRKGRFFRQIEINRKQKKEATMRILLLQQQLNSLLSFGSHLSWWWMDTCKSFASMRGPKMIEVPAN